MYVILKRILNTYVDKMNTYVLLCIKVLWFMVIEMSKEGILMLQIAGGIIIAVLVLCLL